jgi:hypothetical protein
MKNNTKEVQLTNENLLILKELTNEKLAELCMEELTQLNTQALLEELENLLLSLAERGFDLKLLHTYYMDKVAQGQNSYKF